MFVQSGYRDECSGNTVLLIENNFVLIHTNLLLGKALLLSFCIFVGGN